MWSESWLCVHIYHSKFNVKLDWLYKKISNEIQVVHLTESSQNLFTSKLFDLQTAWN